MSAPAFTPGPWSSLARGTVIRVQSQGSKKIAYLPLNQWQSFPVATANAHLIAAAPELYEALKDALAAMEPLGHYYELNDQRDGNLEVPVRELRAVLRATLLARPILAKARGEA